ncbi:3-deoxy-7-phosphoheptulonate synthase class II [Polyangium aurulentum]|uniref:3-deoxy-7-phosphoheptulonate synthase class II n=1 Tax=Polyangium aurulentum TaxID=2567896 RepID=UPI0010ADA8CD|nr:3-deoxy-7-phosphoheptulonate synthase [Polyangium aurulentum]
MPARRSSDSEAAVEHPPSEIPLSRPRSPSRACGWSPTSWKSKPDAQAVRYDDPAAVERVVARIKELPPLVSSWEVERLRSLIADAQLGRRFLLQGGDCAETMHECRADTIANKLEILLKMSLVLIVSGRKPVVRVGRFAGQYAKPRSRPTEIRGGVELPSYFGDLVNGPAFTPEARRPDPERMLSCYQHAAMTLNFVRSLSAGGLSDLQRPECWDLSFSERADLPAPMHESFRATTRQLGDALRCMDALGGAGNELSRVEFFTSHEGLNLHYESAQTRVAPHRSEYYDLTTHMPWLGERTRALDGAHVEFLRGISNPIGIKLGPTVSAVDVLRLLDTLNPGEIPGRIVLITRMGADRVEDTLPPLLEIVKRAGRRVLWVCDPMHGNTITTASGVKTREFSAIVREIERTYDAHDACGTYLGGVHFELTGDDVTECIGGSVREEDLTRAYETLCDPRLNQAQALELSYCIARRMRAMSP